MKVSRINAIRIRTSPDLTIVDIGRSKLHYKYLGSIRKLDYIDTSLNTYIINSQSTIDRLLSLINSKDKTLDNRFYRVEIDFSISGFYTLIYIYLRSKYQ